MEVSNKVGKKTQKKYIKNKKINTIPKKINKMYALKIYNFLSISITSLLSIELPIDHNQSTSKY